MEEEFVVVAVPDIIPGMEMTRGLAASYPLLSSTAMQSSRRRIWQTIWILQKSGLTGWPGTWESGRTNVQCQTCVMCSPPWSRKLVAMGIWTSLRCRTGNAQTQEGENDVEATLAWVSKLETAPALDAKGIEGKILLHLGEWMVVELDPVYQIWEIVERTSVKAPADKFESVVARVLDLKAKTIQAATQSSGLGQGVSAMASMFPPVSSAPNGNIMTKMDVDVPDVSAQIQDLTKDELQAVREELMDDRGGTINEELTLDKNARSGSYLNKEAATFAASFALELPEILFGKETVTNQHRDDRELPAILSHNEWDSGTGHSGAKNTTVKVLMKNVPNIRRCMDRCFSGDAKSVADTMLTDRQALLTELCNWVSRHHYKLLSHTESDESMVLKLVAHDVSVIFQLLYEARGSGRNTGEPQHFFWGTLRAHKVMQDLRAHNFSGHPDLGHALNQHLPVYRYRTTRL
eukprot:scaffold10756_cov62-Attheya_sp.AAC.1